MISRVCKELVRFYPSFYLRDGVIGETVGFPYYHRGLCPLCTTIGSGSCVVLVSNKSSGFSCLKSGTTGFWVSTILHVPVPRNILSMSHELFARFTRETRCPTNPLPGKYVFTGHPIRFSELK